LEGEVIKPVPEKTFLQKYWMYIACVLVALRKYFSSLCVFTPFNYLDSVVRGARGGATETGGLAGLPNNANILWGEYEKIGVVRATTAFTDSDVPMTVQFLCGHQKSWAFTEYGFQEGGFG
jgi:hypothetical protein